VVKALGYRLEGYGFITVRIRFINVINAPRYWATLFTVLPPLHVYLLDSLHVFLLDSYQLLDQLLMSHFG
jgi:hypothetical protein